MSKKNKKNQNPNVEPPQVDNTQVETPQAQADHSTESAAQPEIPEAPDPQVIDSKMDEDGNVVFSSDSYNVPDPKKKIIAIAIIATVLLGIIVGSIIGIVKYKSYTRYYQDTDYPIACKEMKDRTLYLILKDKRTKNEPWSVEVTDPDFVEVTQKGRASGKKSKYILKPKMAGVTNVTFTKEVDLDGVKVTETVLEFMVYVSETPEGLKVSLVDQMALTYGDEVIGAGTDYPVVLTVAGALLGHEDEYLGNIIFLKGKNDWKVEPDISKIDVVESDGDGYSYMMTVMSQGEDEPDQYEDEEYLKSMGSGDTATDLDAARETFPDGIVPTPEGMTFDYGYFSTATDAEEILSEGEIKFSSNSLGITEIRKVTIYSSGRVEFTQVEK